MEGPFSTGRARDLIQPLHQKLPTGIDWKGLRVKGAGSALLYSSFPIYSSISLVVVVALSLDFFCCTPSIFHDRAKSPRRVSEPGRRSLSPSEERCVLQSIRRYQMIEMVVVRNRLPDGSARMYGGGGIPRMTSRSATATPTGSPKRRHLPQIPSALQQTSFARVRQVWKCV